MEQMNKLNQPHFAGQAPLSASSHGPHATSGTLADTPVGQHCRICSVGGTGLMRRRLMDLGVMPDAEITLLRAAPLNDPIEIRVGNAFVSLRRSEAALIDVIALSS